MKQSIARSAFPKTLLSLTASSPSFRTSRPWSGDEMNCGRARCGTRTRSSRGHLCEAASTRNPSRCLHMDEHLAGTPGSLWRDARKLHDPADFAVPVDDEPEMRSARPRHLATCPRDVLLKKR